MNWTKILLIALVFPFSFTASGQTTDDCPTISTLEQIALIQVYYSTGGANWTKSWDFTKPICDWHGVTVTDGVITGLDLNNNNLTGALPTNWLCYLSSLKTLNLYQNELGGSIPTCIGNLTELMTLNLSDNNLTDSIPASICDLTNLSTLSLNGNLLDGEIPDSIGKLSNLTTLDLSDNQLGGALPEGLGNLQNLLILLLNNNDLSGSIPDTIGTLGELLILNLNANQLSGSIPETFAGLIRLIQLDLGNNLLSGSIPAALTQIPFIRNIILSNNQLTGTIPTFTQIYNLEGLCLDGNQFSGTIPAELSNLVYLNKLKLDNNNLEGSLPEELSLLNLLEEFSASNNLLIECFPKSYSIFCDIITNFNENSGMPNNGDFVSWCETKSCSNKEGQGIVFEIEGAALSCYNGDRIAVNISQGTAPFWVQIVQDGRYRGQFQIANLSFQIRGMQAGAYDITIIDANNYQATEELVISTECQLVETEVASSRSQSNATIIHLADLIPDKNMVEVFANYPNPFTQGTTLPFSLSATQDLTISISNATGQQVYHVNQTYEAGNHQLQLEENIFKQTGLYIYQVQYGEELITGKLIKL